jgi:hypothetical protein
LRNAVSSVGFQHDLQQVHDIVVVDSLRDLDQQPVVPNAVKGKYDRLPITRICQNQ